MEAEFFSDTSIYYPALAVLLVITVPIIYLYFLPKHETMILFLYTIILVYILDLVGKDVNISLFLVTLFSILILFTHSLYTANAIRTGHKKPNFIFYLILLTIIFGVNGLLSLGVYEYVLKPNVNEKNQLYIAFEDKSQSNEVLSDSEQDNNSGGGGSGGAVEEPIDWLNILKYLLLLILLFILLYLVYRFIKYRLWVRKLNKMSYEDQIITIYSYIIMSLGIVGIEKKPSQTAYEFVEYLKTIDVEHFPYDLNEFFDVTESFIKVSYSGKTIDEKAYGEVKRFFKDIASSMKSFLGYRKYFTSYIFKIQL